MADSLRLSDDIEAMLNALFQQNTDEARTLLLGYADNEPERVRKAILKLSEGNLADLTYYVERGNQDYRDTSFTGPNTLRVNVNGWPGPACQAFIEGQNYGC